MYQIQLTKQVHQAVRRMPPDMVEMFQYKVNELAAKSNGSQDTHQKPRGFKGHRFYVDEWHVLYEINDNSLDILSCNHRSARRCIEMTVQIIERDRRPEWAVISYEMYQQLLEDSEMLQDIRDYEAAKKALQSDEELIPGNVTYAILEGEKPIKVWRKYRGMTQSELSEMAGITKAYLSQIETGKRAGTPDVLNKLAKALGLTLDEIRSS